MKLRDGKSTPVIDVYGSAFIAVVATLFDGTTSTSTSEPADPVTSNNTSPPQSPTSTAPGDPANT
jgi:hypothetical protein